MHPLEQKQILLPTRQVEVVEAENCAHDLGHSKFTLWEANGQPMLTTGEKNFTEMVYMGGEILAED